jgi:DNA-binding beta-propeller fold protein YncE
MLVFKFDAKTGQVTPNNTPPVVLPPGSGPRHYAFQPSGRWVRADAEDRSDERQLLRARRRAGERALTGEYPVHELKRYSSASLRAGCGST